MNQTVQGFFSSGFKYHSLISLTGIALLIFYHFKPNIQIINFSNLQPNLQPWVRSRHVNIFRACEAYAVASVLHQTPSVCRIVYSLSRDCTHDEASFPFYVVSHDFSHGYCAIKNKYLVHCFGKPYHNCKLW